MSKITKLAALALATTALASPASSDQPAFFRLLGRTQPAGPATGSGGTAPAETPATTPTTTPDQPEGANASAMSLSYQPARQSLMARKTPDYYSSPQFSASRGQPPYSYSATGLPDGTGITSDEGCYCGIVTGTPAAKGVYSTFVTVRDSVGNVATGTYQIPVGDVEGGSPFASLASFPLYLNQPYYGTGDATAIPDPSYDNAVTLSLAPGSAPLPDGLAFDTAARGFNGSTLFAYGSQTPTRGGTFRNVVMRATYADGSFADSAPVTFDVAAPALVADAKPGTLSLTPGQGVSPSDFFASLTYGNFSYPQDANAMGSPTVTLNGTPPAGMTFDPGTLSFSGFPTGAGDTATLSFTASVPGAAPVISPSFTLSVKDVLAATATYPECQAPPPPFNFPGMPPSPPGETNCQQATTSGPTDVPVLYDAAFKMDVTTYGSPDAVLSLAPGSSVPPGMTFSGRTLSGQSQAPGSYAVTFRVSAPGKQAADLGPLTLNVGDASSAPEAGWWLPKDVAFFLPIRETEHYCQSAFETANADTGPYTGVSGTNLPKWLYLTPDGQVCNTEGAWSEDYYRDPGSFQTTGTMTATNAYGETATRAVRYSAQIRD